MPSYYIVLDSEQEVSEHQIRVVADDASRQIRHVTHRGVRVADVFSADVPAEVED